MTCLFAQTLAILGNRLIQVFQEQYYIPIHRSRFWFHFAVDNVQNGQRVIFNICNLSRTRCLFRSGLTPVVRSTSRPRWYIHFNMAMIYFSMQPSLQAKAPFKILLLLQIPRTFRQFCPELCFRL